MNRQCILKVIGGCLGVIGLKRLKYIPANPEFTELAIATASSSVLNLNKEHH